MAWGLGVDGRPTDGLQSPHRARKALCGSCDARDGERIRSRGLSRTGVARVCGDVGSVAGWPSGREWNGLEPGQGATELGFPRPAPGEMQSEAARRAGDPSHQSEDPPPEGPALAQPGHQHLTGAGGNGQQRVIPAGAGIAVVAITPSSPTAMGRRWNWRPIIAATPRSRTPYATSSTASG